MDIEKHEIDTFIGTVKDFINLKLSDQIDYFVYFLTSIKNNETAQAVAIRECFLKGDLTPHTNIPQYLTGNIKARGKNSPKFLKTKTGYLLHRNFKASLEQNIIKKPLKAKISNDLRQLLSHISNPIENEFLTEAINCFEISAYRASTVMVWNLTIDHLYEYILKHKLGDFNTVLSKNTDKRIKITSVAVKDDFGEIPEGKFIEFSKSANIISNDIRKILDTKLGIRNSYAHPSNIKIVESKATEFIEDLVNNVILKFKL